MPGTLKITKHLGTALAVLGIALGLSACGLERGWTARDKNDFKSAVCESWAGVSRDSKTCSCLLDATRAAYPHAEDFTSAEEPSSALLIGWRLCGVGVSE